MPCKILAVGMLVLFFLTFSPLPLRLLAGDMGMPEPGQSAWLALPLLAIAGVGWYARRRSRAGGTHLHRSQA